MSNWNFKEITPNRLGDEIINMGNCQTGENNGFTVGNMLFGSVNQNTSAYGSLYFKLNNQECGRIRLLHKTGPKIVKHNLITHSYCLEDLKPNNSRYADPANPDNPANYGRYEVELKDNNGTIKVINITGQIINRNINRICSLLIDSGEGGALNEFDNLYEMNNSNKYRYTRRHHSRGVPYYAPIVTQKQINVMYCIATLPNSEVKYKNQLLYYALRLFSGNKNPEIFKMDTTVFNQTEILEVVMKNLRKVQRGDSHQQN